MKKVLFLLVFCVLATRAATAQNANRSGFFIEGAVGGTTGNTPRTSYGLDNENLTMYHAHGTAVNFALGFRARISSYAAYEFSLEAQSPVDAFKTQPVFKVMPLSFRFTTKEFWRNYSFYINFRIGGAIGNKGEFYGSDPLQDDNIIDVNLFRGMSAGAAYQIGVGINLSNHFYAGFSWDAQLMFQQIRNLEPENIHWGMTGLRLGYRF